MSVKIYHNPRCTKSRQTLQLLQDNGVEPEVVLYLETAPSADELTEILQKLGGSAKQLIRFKEALAKELGISAKDERSDDEWVQLLAKHPKLIERPVVVKGNKAVLGRPPENALALL